MSKTFFGSAKLADALRISILMKTVYIEAYATEGITFEYANFIEKRFSTEYISDLIRVEPDRIQVAYFNGNPIAVAELLFESKCRIRNMEVAELSKLYVLHRFSGQGIGRQLLRTCEEVLIKKNFREINLEVYAENLRAIAFYERQDYQKLGRVDFPMEKNTYENWVMNKKLI